jgi:hypothetical protein
MLCPLTRKTLADWARPASDYIFFCVYRPSIIVATARRANPRNNSQKLIEPKAIKLPRKPSQRGMAQFMNEDQSK